MFSIFKPLKFTGLKLFTFLFICSTLLLANALHAQDIHFSMFYASPLNLNPALAGVSEGSYRVSGIYRNQWRSISTPFVTYSGSFDTKLLQKLLPNDILAIGVNFVGDKSKDGNLSVNNGMVSIAFHKGLDKKHNHFIGLGLQLGYTSKSLKWQQLAFPNQFNGQDFDLNTPNFEAFAKQNIGFFDMNIGLLHQSKFSDKFSMMTGFTIYHLVPGKESYFGDKNLYLPRRYTVHTGFRIKAAKNFFITPNFIYQYQNKAQEINIGTAFEYHIPAGKSEAVVSVGGWYRIQDAAIVNASVEYYKVKLMFAYDLTTSKLQNANKTRGGFELAISYTGFIKPRAVKSPELVPCPIM